jgi:arginase family enzyme
MQPLMSAEEGFLAFPETELATLENAKVVVQLTPYEHSSSYLMGSDKGPAAMVEASHFVEFYDEEIDREAYKNFGIATLQPIDFTGAIDADAVKLIADQTRELLNRNKFVVSLGSEHTVTYGYMQAYAEKYPNISVLQIDAQRFESGLPRQPLFACQRNAPHSRYGLEFGASGYPCPVHRRKPTHQILEQHPYLVCP